MQYMHIELQSFGGPENLAVVQETELPEPQRGQVRVKVLASGAGYRHCYSRRQVSRG